MLLTLLLTLVCMALVIGIYVFIIGMGVVAPSIVFSILIALTTWQKAGWIIGLLSGAVVYCIICYCARYRKIFKAITIFTAFIINYFMVLLIAGFFPALKGDNNTPSFLGFLISLVMAGISLFLSFNRKNSFEFADEDPLWSRLLASVIYGYTAACLFVFALSSRGGVLIDLISWVLFIGGAFAHFVLTEKPTSFYAVLSELRQELSIKNLFKKGISSNNTSNDWVEPEYDYDIENYGRNYPRRYEMRSYSMLEDGVVFTRDVNDFLIREEIKRVIFTDAPFPEGLKLVDLSLDQDRSIMGWNQTIGDDFCLVISTGEKGKGIQLNPACNFMFAGFENVKSIEWNNVVDTSRVVAMKEMFAGCYKIPHLDLSSFDVSNVKYMDGMFSTCRNLKDIDWFRFNTSKVEDTSYMFTNCQRLKSVDLRGFDTTSLKSCKKMFNDCYMLKAVNLGNWYPTSNERELCVENMFRETTILSCLTTSNPLVENEYLNPDESTAKGLTENEIVRKIVPVTEWKVPVYEWEKELEKKTVGR